jgi:hypothetical protein
LPVSQGLIRATTIAILALIAVPPALAAQTPGPCTHPVEACTAFSTFLDALNRRDWAGFQATLDDSISVIVDAADFAERRDYRAGTEEVFRRIFPAIPPAAGTLPAVVQPEGLRVQEFGEVVIFTFHLRNPGRIGRRTVVLHRGPAGWRVVHIHGSSEPLPPA